MWRVSVSAQYGTAMTAFYATFSFIESRLSVLLAELERKKFELSGTTDQAEGLQEKLERNNAKIAGLCIRCLDTKLLRLVLSYLGGPKSSASSVCKYWLKSALPEPENESAK
jgi:hypothetical protein